MTKQEALQVCEWAAKQVATWPEWERRAMQALENSPNCKVPRQPIEKASAQKSESK
jgi:hypothetical protein